MRPFVRRRCIDAGDNALRARRLAVCFQSGISTTDKFPVGIIEHEEDI